MKCFYVVKSGFEILDLATAYGLAWSLEHIKKSQETVILKDSYSYYLIESPDIDFTRIKAIRGLLPTKIDNSLEVGLATLNLKERRNFFENLKKFLESNIDIFKLIFKKFSTLETANQFFSVFDRRSPLYGSIDPLSSQHWRSQNCYSPLYGSIDPRGFKGERKKKKTITYGEGETYKNVPIENLFFAILGISKFALGQQSFRGLREWILFFPVPNSKNGIEIKFLEEDIEGVKDKISTIHSCGALATVVLSTLYLEKEIITRKHELGIWGIIFIHLVGTAQKPKAGKEGKLPLEILNKLASDLSESDYSYLIDFWIDLIEISKKDIMKELGITLSSFIFQPDLRNFEKYIRTHLHLYLNPRTHEKFFYHGKKVELYPQDLLKKICKHVRRDSFT